MSYGTYLDKDGKHLYTGRLSSQRANAKLPRGFTFHPEIPSPEVGGSTWDGSKWVAPERPQRPTLQKRLDDLEARIKALETR